MLPLNCPGCGARLPEPPMAPTPPASSPHVFVGVVECERCHALVRILCKGGVVHIKVVDDGMCKPEPTTSGVEHH